MQLGFYICLVHFLLEFSDFCVVLICFPHVLILCLSVLISHFFYLGGQVFLLSLELFELVALLNLFVDQIREIIEG